MTDQHSPDTPPGVRVMTDGGVDRKPKEKRVNARAKDVVTREVSGDEVEMLRVPISSTRTDREGDRFAKEALDGMAEQIREEQPFMFQNHGLAGSWMDAIPYDQAHTIAGHMDAEVVQEDDGEYVLNSFVNPDGTHEEGERLLKQVRDEYQPVKFSVGFKILNSDPIEDDAGNEIGRKFTDVDLMEDSKVGIPANRDATVTHDVAAKDGTEALPGYQMHPMVQMMQAFGGQPTEGTAVKQGLPTVTDGGETDETLHDTVADLAAAVGELRAEVAELREDDDDDDDDDDDEDEGSPCDDNGDCPDGEVCVDGECVPEDEVDESTDPDATDSFDADGATDEELRERIAELEDAVKDGPGESETGDTSTNDGTDLVDDGKDDEPDETNDADPTDHEPLL